MRKIADQMTSRALVPFSADKIQQEILYYVIWEADRVQDQLPECLAEDQEQHQKEDYNKHHLFHILSANSRHMIKHVLIEPAKRSAATTNTTIQIIRSGNVIGVAP